MSLDKNLLEKADKTIQVVSETLKGLDFAVTGSYAYSVVGGRPRQGFNFRSDLDIALSEDEISEAISRLKDLPEVLRAFPFYGYDGNPPPRHSGYKIFIEGLLPIHLTQTLKPEQKSDYVLKDGVNFLPPHYYWNKN